MLVLAKCQENILMMEECAQSMVLPALTVTKGNPANTALILRGSCTNLETGLHFLIEAASKTVSVTSQVVSNIARMSAVLQGSKKLNLETTPKLEE